MLKIKKFEELEKKYGVAAAGVYYTAEEVRALPLGPQGQLPIVVVSYCWGTATHADPRSENLQALVDVLKREQGRNAKTRRALPLPAEVAIFIGALALEALLLLGQHSVDPGTWCWQTGAPSAKKTARATTDRTRCAARRRVERSPHGGWRRRL